MKNGVIILLAVILCSCYLGEELPPDQEAWEYAHPGSVGMDPTRLYELNDGLKDGGFGQIHGLVVIKDDQLVFENYYNNGSRHDLVSMGSNTFTVMSLAMDIFLEEGLITSLDEPIYPYLPEYETIFEIDPVKKEITFRHILSYKMGLSWDEDGTVENDYGKMKESGDWVEFILSKPRDTPNPGTRFSPNSAGAIVIAKIVQNQLGEADLDVFLKENLFDQIGIRDHLWEKSPNGILNAANGLQLTTIDQTRLGYLMLLEGRWSEKKRIITRDWVFSVSSAATTLNPQYSYGYGWRILTEDYKEDLQLEETSTYYAYGGSGQGIFIIPEYKLIVSISAENYFGNAETMNFFIFFSLLQSLEPAVVN